MKYLIFFERMNYLFYQYLILITKDEIKATAEYLMSQIDPENTGFVTESQFVENIKQYYTEQELSEILTYDLIPTELLESAHMQQSLPGVADFSTPNVKQDIVQVRQIF